MSTAAWLVVRVESLPDVAGCPVCGVVAHAHDRDDVTSVDVPSFGRPVRLVWVKRRYARPEPAVCISSPRGYGQEHSFD
ncbi:transposase family protein [Arsenicicoccus dermatophilus]|uniref:transposase family protein n=1 Tax=Arsenicicoccus dermatophilus TaxID=1076331 RepID=UPI001F4C7414|nr:transposase family protein [Arsenicicoccus dermatophilus]MCH8613499.1 transposase family protein [Arsenicicoccus dermatophilus]